MGDKLKSAYELAMEKLKRKERASSGEAEAPAKLTARQKEKIEGIRREVRAKLAELEILFKSEQRSAGGDFEKLNQIEAGYLRDRERLLTRQEERIREARRGRASDA